MCSKEKYVASHDFNVTSWLQSCEHMLNCIITCCGRDNAVEVIIFKASPSRIVSASAWQV